MARIRSIKPEIFSDPKVMNCTVPARHLFIGTITQADDEGRGSADPRSLRAAIFPGDDMSVAEILNLLVELERERLVVLYDGPHGERLYALPGWATNQVINRPTPSKRPPPPGSPALAVQQSRSNHGAACDTSVTVPEGSEGSDGSDRSDRKEGSDRSDTRSARPPALGPKAGRADPDKAVRRAQMARDGLTVKQILERERGTV